MDSQKQMSQNLDDSPQKTRLRNFVENTIPEEVCEMGYNFFLSPELLQEYPYILKNEAAPTYKEKFLKASEKCGEKVCQDMFYVLKSYNNDHLTALHYKMELRSIIESLSEKKCKKFIQKIWSFFFPNLSIEDEDTEKKFKKFLRGILSPRTKTRRKATKTHSWNSTNWFQRSFVDQSSQQSKTQKKTPKTGKNTLSDSKTPCENTLTKR